MNKFFQFFPNLRGFNGLFYKLRKNQFLIKIFVKIFNFDIGIKLYGVKGKVYVNLAKHPHWVFGSGLFELQLFSLFLAINKVFQPKVFYDIGANIGFYSWLLLSQNDEIKVVMFEPDPHNLALLNKTITHTLIDKEKIKLVSQALSDTTGVATFAIDNITSATGTLLHSRPTFIETQYSQKPILTTVETITLDDYYQSHETTELVDFIKIDVEGFEKQVFDGGENFIKKNQPIIIFECSANNRKYLLSRLETWGYQIFSADSVNGKITEAYNVLAIPNKLSSLSNQLLETWSLEMKKLQEMR